MNILKYLMFCLVLSVFIPTVAKAEGTIQSKIDEVSAGATIEIDSGEYEETLVINKPINLVGKGEVHLRSCQSKPTVTISGESVTLKNMKVEHCGKEKEDTAIYITGSHHKLEGISVATKRIGIKLDQANSVKIQNSKIVGNWQGNGIDLWKSNQNKFENNKITNITKV